MGRTSLMFATRKGNIDSVKLLISAGAELNTENYLNMTPLMIAAAGGHVGCFNELVTAGADINITNARGDTGFYVCRCRWKCRMCKAAHKCRS